jgi:hypothetical protein
LGKSDGQIPVGNHRHKYDIKMDHKETWRDDFK